MTQRTYTVLAAETMTELETRGADMEMTFDTLKEARKRARYYLTEEYMHACESSTRLGYARIIDRDGDIVSELENKK